MYSFLGIAAAFWLTQDAHELPKLIEGLSSPEIAVRDRAVEQIVAGWDQWGDADFRRLEECARGADPEPATRAASALVQIRTRKALGRELIAAMPDIDLSSDDGRWNAIASARERWRIGDLSGSALAKLVKLANERGGVANPNRLRAFLEYGPRPAAYADLVVPLLRHRDPEIRRSAMIALADFDPQAHVGELALLLKDENNEVRQAAAYTLAEMQAVDQADRIAALLSDSDPEVRSWALDAVESLRAPECADRVVALLDSPPEAYAAAHCLGELGAEAYAPKIVDLLRATEDETNRIFLQAVLARMQAVEYAELLVQYLEGPRASWAVTTWRVMGAHDYSPRIAPFLGTNDRGLRLSAQGALCILGAKDFLPQVISSFETVTPVESWLPWIAAVDQCEQVAVLLKDGYWIARAGAASALGFMGAKEHADAVERLLDDPSAAPWALRALGWMGANDRSKRIARFLDKGNPEEIEAALDALAELEATEHVPEILPHLMSPHEPIQRKAALTLQRLVGPLPADKRKEPIGAILAALPDGWEEDKYTFGPIFLLFPNGAKNRRRIFFELVGDIEGKKWIQDALLQTYENEAYRKLTEPFVLQKPITSEADLVLLCGQRGFKIDRPQFLRLEGRVTDGIRTSLLRLLERCWEKGPIVVDRDRVQLLTPQRAIRYWERRLEEAR